MKQFMMFIVISMFCAYLITGIAGALNGGYVQQDISYYLILFFVNWRIYRAVTKFYNAKGDGDE